MDSGKRARGFFTVRTDWPQAGRTAAHTGYNPYERLLGAANVAQLRQAWAVPLGAGAPVSPVVFGNVALGGSQGGPLVAVGARMGGRRWTRTLGAGLSGPAAVHDQRVFAPAGDGSIRAFALRSGRPLWKTAIGTGTTLLAAYRGAVYGLDVADGRLHALDARTGTFRWTARAPGGDQLPAVAGGRVFVSSSGGREGWVTAYRADTGARLWQRAFSEDSGSAPVVSRGRVFVVDARYLIRAFDAVTGKPLWDATLDEYYSGGEPAVADGVVYAADTEGRVGAFDAATGARRWMTPPLAVAGSVSVANGLVYAGSTDGRTVAVDAGSGVAWCAGRRTTAGASRSSSTAGCTRSPTGSSASCVDAPLTGVTGG